MIHKLHIQAEPDELQKMAKKHRQNNGLQLIPCPNCGRKKLFKDGHYVECQHCEYWKILLPGQDF